MLSMGDSKPRTPVTRPSVPTPYIDHDDAIVMIGPSAVTRVACLDAAIELGVRPIQASWENASKVVTTVRPLVIVAEERSGLTPEELTDMAVSVGAQLVVTGPADVGPALAERVKLAGRAARVLRNRPVRNT